MKKWLRCAAGVLMSFLVAFSPLVSMSTYASTLEDECDAGGIRYYDCLHECDSNHSCDTTRSDSVALIGDSITADTMTKDLLQQGIPSLTNEYYNAKSSRPWADGLDILKNEMLSKEAIIYELGTNNANFSKDNIKEVMDIVGNTKTVFFVTNYASNDNYPWFEEHNRLFQEASQEYNNVKVIDWAALAKEKGFKLDDPSLSSYGLGVHPYSQEEHEAFANLIIDAVSSGVCRVGPLELLGNNAEEMVWSGLLSAGFTMEQAAGIMGSMEGESGFNPARHETALHDRYGGNFQLDANPDVSYGLGLIQWSFGRRIAVYNYIKEKAPDLTKYLDDSQTYGYNVSGDEFLQKAGDDGKELLAFELAFLYEEISNSSTYGGLIKQETVSEASEFFVRHIEVPGYMEQAVRDRDVWSHEKYNAFKDRSDLIPSNYDKGNISAAPVMRLADATLGGDNKDYNGDPVFTEEQMAKIREFQPFYEKAVEGTSIPWEMAAIIHTRESNLSRTNPNADGLFQFYQSGIYQTGAYVDDAEFVEQLHTMVETHLVPKWVDGLSIEDQVKQIFFGYNGKAGVYISQARDLGFTQEQAELGEGSPYVMNKADEKRDPNKAKPGTWGQIKTDGGPIEYPANQAHGGFVMYVALHGGDYGDSCAGAGRGTGRNAIDKAAHELAWPVGSENTGKVIATEAYEQAAKALNNWYPPGGADCGYFAGTVISVSGVDPDFPLFSPTKQWQYMLSSPKWEDISHLNNGTDESFLQVGDVLVVHGINRYGHIRIIVDLGNGTLGTAEASYNNYSGELHEYIGLDAGLGRGLYQVFRLKE